jgi:predicted MFS family arabinose efflux permease
MVTPLTQKYFDFGELENSVMYCVCGVEVIAGFLFVHWLSRRAKERVVLAVGLAICNISSVWCLIFLANPIGVSASHGSTSSVTLLTFLEELLLD